LVNASDDVGSAQNSLLIASASGAVTHGDAFRSEATRIANWHALADAADHHGVGPLLHCAFERICPDVPPAEIRARLRGLYRESAARGLVLSVALLAAQRALRAEGVAALALKGPMVAARLYPDPALRPFSDIDVLVRRADVPAALRALAQLGYKLDRRLARLPVGTLLALSTEVLVRGPEGVALDLHWEVARRGYPFRFDPELLFGRVRTSRLDGWELPDLESDALLVFLCMHGTKHAWSRLMWVGDVARLARAGFDEAATLGFAERCGCRRPVLLGLLVAHALLDAPVPAAILERARAEPTVAALARDAARRLARHPSEERPREVTTFNAILAECTWDRAKHYSALLAPSEAELTRLRLPASLRALYYPFRLARLAAKYTLKLAGGRR
jgi:hypothetical protein